MPTKLLVTLIAAASATSALAQAPATAPAPRAPAAAPAPAPQAPAAPAPTATAAPASGAFAVGAQVKDPQGGAVGSITAVDGEFVNLKTDRHDVRLPKTSFTAAAGGLILGLTQAEVNAEVDRTQASAATRLVAGASVTGSQGGNVGTIEAIDAQFVTLKLTSGKSVRLQRSAIAPGPNGGVIGLTAAELEAEATAAAPAAE